ncbi:MAG: DUF4038 domain-containing protein [Thermoanaerobaculia bacterium]
MAFPLTPQPWRWNWSTTCETPATCGATTPSLVTAGWVDVYKYGPTGSPLYAKGPLKRVDYSWPRTNPTRFWSELRHERGAPFAWVGDSAWAAPMRARPALGSVPDEWLNYLNIRKASIPKGAPVTIVQIGTAPPWSGATDAAGKPPFDAVGSCSSAPPLPRSCSLPNPDFWAAFDNKIKVANDSGLYILLAGLMEPRSEHPTGTGPQHYPSLSEAKTFARYLTARLAGSLVILSPGWDSKVITKDGEILQRAVGNEIKLVAPHMLVTNHWGTIETSEMDDVHSDAWLDFQMFQSGHNDNATHDSPTQLADLTRRARKLAWEMSGTSYPALAPYSTVRKPLVNGEGIYEQNNMPNGNYSIYRARQVGYLSWLSGALGYTFGFGGVWDWGLCGTATPNACDNYQMNPGWRTYSEAMAQPSNAQMKYMAAFMASYQSGSGWGTLDTYEGGPVGPGLPGRVMLPNPNTTPEEQKVAFARNGGYLLAYLPHNSLIKLNTYGLTVSAAAGKLFDPQFGTFDVVADGANPRYTCGGTGSGAWCQWENKGYRSQQPQNSDRVLIVPACAAGTCIPTGFASLLVFGGSLAEGKPWGILAEPLGPDGAPKGSIFEVSSSEDRLLLSPAMARSPKGEFLVAWETDENGDGAREVWGRMVKGDGTLVGPELLLSPQDERHHSAPTVGANSQGNFLVAWESRDPMDGSTEVLAQAVSSSSLLSGGTVTLVAETGFRSFSPRLAGTVSDEFTLAWIREEDELADPAVLVRRFEWNGTPAGSAQVVSATAAPIYWLEGVSLDGAGNAIVSWEARDLGSSLGGYRATFDSTGSLVGGEELFAPPIGTE